MPIELLNINILNWFKHMPSEQKFGAPKTKYMSPGFRFPRVYENRVVFGIDYLLDAVIE